MSLNVLPNGQGTSKGMHLSFFVCLMAGEYDNSLEWPFQGEVTVELLNQLEDQNHKKITICYNESTEGPCKERVQSQEGRAKGWGRRRFISHEELEYNPTANCQYLKDDSLYFRVSVKAKVESAVYMYCNP
uniref:MATH domain-containing protein n=1 Tax=Amphimedon queenslandica TaxID=400682 RepID=A0A1X7TDB5_AMPQE